MIKRWFKKSPPTSLRAEDEIFDGTPVLPLQQEETSSYAKRSAYDDLGSEAVVHAARLVN